MVKWTLVLAVFLTFDVDGEAPYLYRGDDYVQYTRGRFGIKKGLPRVLHLLDKYGVKATFNICGYIAETYPETVREIAAKRHDVAVHGFLHEDFTKLSREEASTTLDRAMRALEDACGVKPAGFRAPYWRMPKFLLELLVNKGFIWDSSLMDDDSPYVMKLSGEARIVEFPVSYVLDDWVLFEDKAVSHVDALKTWRYELDWAMEEEVPFILTLHPHVIGRGGRIKVLEELVKYALARKASFCRCTDEAKLLLARAEGVR